jgi:glycerol-3-phosphate dehydrogenase (NAD(P)+)
VRNGHEVRIWGREPEVVDSINRDGINSLFLPDCPLASGLVASGSLADALRGAELIVSATPSHAVREITSSLSGHLGGSRPIVVSVSKGLETETLMVMTQIMVETLPGLPTVALSGPSFADEVFARRPSAIVAAAADSAAARTAQRAFSASHLRVYTSGDPMGVQLAGALKNVIAIAAGALDGLGLGNNARAALITRGLAEMTRLGLSLGCDPMTFAGLAGMGDLILTTSGAQSRNRSLGQELAAGRSLEQILAERRTVAEGVLTTRAAVVLGERAGVELPIAQEVENVLFEGKELAQAVSDLMERELKPENWS